MQATDIVISGVRPSLGEDIGRVAFDLSALVDAFRDPITVRCRTLNPSVTPTPLSNSRRLDILLASRRRSLRGIQQGQIDDRMISSRRYSLAPRRAQIGGHRVVQPGSRHVGRDPTDGTTASTAAEVSKQ